MTFQIPFDDLGAGAVNTVPALSGGSNTATFTRATTAWTKLSTGLWAQVASGTARSCYLGLNTSIGAYGGYLSEIPATQLTTPTAAIRDMTNAAWVKVNMTAAKTATGIDGVINSASTITATAGAATILITLIAVATTRTYGPFIRRKTGTGTILIQQGATTLDITALINSSTYTQVQLPASVLNAAYGITISTNGDALDVDFNQFEAGAFSTSPIDNTGTRNRDILQYPIAGNISSTVGTVYCQSVFNGIAANQALIGDSATNNTLIRGNSTSTAMGSDDGTNTAVWTTSARTQNVLAKFALTYTGSVMQLYKDGVAATGTTTFDGSFNLTALQVGSVNSDNEPNGIIRNVMVYSQALTPSQIATL